MIVSLMAFLVLAVWARDIGSICDILKGKSDEASIIKFVDASSDQFPILKVYLIPLRSSQTCFSYLYNSNNQDWRVLIDKSLERVATGEESEERIACALSLASGCVVTLARKNEWPQKPSKIKVKFQKVGLLNLGEHVHIRVENVTVFSSFIE